MKRAKFMLAAVAVVAIAGGVYASKASKLSRTIFLRANIEENLCTVPLAGHSLAFIGQPAVSTSFATTTTGPCPNSVPYYTAQ